MKLSFRLAHIVEDVKIKEKTIHLIFTPGVLFNINFLQTWGCIQFPQNWEGIQFSGKWSEEIESLTQ